MKDRDLTRSLVLNPGESFGTDAKGRPVVIRTCIRCEGRGRYFPGVCFRCNGKGVEQVLASTVLAKQRRKAYENQERVRGMRSFVRGHSSLLPLLREKSPFCVSLRQQLIRKGSLSDKQIDSLYATREKCARKELEKADAQRHVKVPGSQTVENTSFFGRIPEELLTDVLPGRRQITGVVTSVKERMGFNGYGVWKMLVVVSDGSHCHKIYGSVPKALLVAPGAGHANLRGKIVSFTAAVSPSPTEKGFGYYSRPVGGEIIGEYHNPS